MDLDLDHLRSWIGREEAKSEPVTTALVERFDATFGRTGDTTPGAAAPVMIHLCLAPPAAPMDQLGPDGHPARGGFLPPVPLPRRMWGGSRIIVDAPIRVGEAVSRRIEALLRRELALFPDWYLAKHRGVAVEGALRETLDKTFDLIVARNLAAPQVYVHRDFMPRNLMASSDDTLGVLDFQDAVYGPASYDIASLMRDAFLTWDEEFVLDITVRYWERARKAGLPVGPGRVIGAVRAVEAAGFSSREDFSLVLEACFVSRPEHRAVFAQVFRLVLMGWLRE